MYKGLMQNLQAEAATGNTPALVQIGWAFLDYFSNNFSYTSPQEIIDQYDASDKTFLTDNFLPNVLDLAVNSDGVQGRNTVFFKQPGSLHQPRSAEGSRTFRRGTEDLGRG